VKRNFAHKTQDEVFEGFNLTSECTIVHPSKGMLFTTLKGKNKSNPVN
jgi:hypothetical protein